MNNIAYGLIGLSILNASDNKEKVSSSHLITDFKHETGIENNGIEIILNSTPEANSATKKIAATNNIQYKLLNESCPKANYFKSFNERRLTLYSTPFTYKL